MHTTSSAGGFDCCGEVKGKLHFSLCRCCSLSGSANPPYFEQSLLSPDAARTTARHTTSLQYETIFELSRRLILPQGTLSLIIPTALYTHVNSIAMLHGWGATRHTQVHTTPRKAAKRSLCEWQRNHYAPCQENTLYIHDAAGNYTAEYIELTRQFYLQF